LYHYPSYLEKEKRKEAKKRKEKFSLPNEAGSHFVKRKKIKEMSKISSSASSFREQMMSRHNRTSAQQRRNNIEKISFLKKQ